MSTVLSNGVELREQKPKGRPQVSRARADDMIERIVEVAQEIAGDPRFGFEVAKMAVFGSYLSDKPVLGDLDIAVEVAACWKPRFQTHEALRAATALSFPPPASIQTNWFGAMCWPETVVWRRLKIGRGVSLHPFSELEVCGFPSKLIYERSAR